MGLIQRLRVRNFRSHSCTDLRLDSVNLIFGPNTAGKSTLFDALWLMRDCAARGVQHATAKRGHGIGMRWKEAAAEERVHLEVEVDGLAYEIRLGFVDGRTEDTPGETLRSVDTNVPLLQRGVGETTVKLSATGQQTPLREPERLSLDVLQFYDQSNPAVSSLDQTLRNLRYFHCRSFNLYALRHRGSENGTDWRLNESGINLWTILRNLESRRAVDKRYSEIRKFLKQAFPALDDVILQASGPDFNTGSFLEFGSEFEVRPSAVADGVLQCLLLLTALFGEPQGQTQTILLDEPETSLHPWAIYVLSEAVKEATQNWGRQVLIATHSPVLLSMFDPKHLIELTPSPQGTKARRLEDRSDIQDLIDRYAAGSLYMMQLIGEQSEESMVHEVDVGDG